MAKITFWGATGTVTGSRFYLNVDDLRLLIDCGSFQGTKENRLRNWDPFPVPPNEIDRVLVTHAHIDHTGHLPRLCKEGFNGTVHCSHTTHQLSKILLRDSAHIHEEDASLANEKGFTKHKPALPLYTVEDAEQVLRLFSPLHYGEDFFMSDAVRVKLKNAGHILGSSFIDIRTRRGAKTRKILFGGDFGRPAQPVLSDPVQVYDVDYLVLESTYGDRLHEEISPSERLAAVVNDSVKRGGVLLIPSFAVGRTQTLLYILRDLEKKGEIPVLPVYMDSPMSIEATDIFEKRIRDMDITSRMLTLKGEDIFRTGRLCFCKSKKESMAINEVRDHAIIISSSGMVTGGRILHHMRQRLPHQDNTVLFIGYQAEGTRGRSILEGEPTVKIHGEQIPVHAKVENISGFSGHGDYNEILAWLMGFNRPPEKTFIVHGEPAASSALAEKIRAQFKWDVVIPAFGESHDLDL